jgi:hypothetical protein
MNRKQISVISVISGLIFLCGGIIGCDQSPAQRVAQVKAVVDKANALNQQVDVTIEQLDAVVQASMALLADPNIPDSARPAVQQALANASGKIAALKKEKAKITAALMQWQAIIGAVDLNTVNEQTEFAAYGSAITAIAPSLPASVGNYVALAGLLIPLLAGLIASVIKNLNQVGQINEGKFVLTDLVTSVDKLLNPKTNEGVIPADKIEDAKFILQDNQAGVTQDTVDAIKDPMQNTAPAK